MGYHKYERRCAICKKRDNTYYTRYNNLLMQNENWICDDCIKKIKELIDSH